MHTFKMNQFHFFEYDDKRRLTTRERRKDIHEGNLRRMILPIRLIALHRMSWGESRPSIDAVYHESPMVERVVRIQRENFSVEQLYQ